MVTSTVIRNGQCIDGPILLTISHKIQGGKLRVKLVKSLHGFIHLVVTIITIKPQGHLNFLTGKRS